MSACDSPLEVDGGDVEHDSFEPEDHEEALGEGTVSDALSVTACLHTNTTRQFLSKRNEIRYLVEIWYQECHIRNTCDGENNRTVESRKL